MKSKKQTINIQGTNISIISKNKDDYISLTDMLKAFGDDNIIYNWMRNRSTIEFLGLWEKCIIQILNLSNSIGLKMKLALITFTMSPKQ